MRLDDLTVGAPPIADYHAMLLERAELLLDVALMRSIAENERQITRAPVDAQAELTRWFLCELARVRKDALAAVRACLAAESIH